MGHSKGTPEREVHSNTGLPLTKLKVDNLGLVSKISDLGPSDEREYVHLESQTHGMQVYSSLRKTWGGLGFHILKKKYMFHFQRQTT